MFIHIREVSSRDEVINENHTYAYDSWALNSLGDVKQLNNKWFNYTEDVLVKENCHSDMFLRIYLKWCNPGKNFCSHLFLVKNDTQEFILTDCAFNVKPTVIEQVKIVENAAKFWRCVHPELITDEPIHVNYLNYSGEFNINNPVARDAICVKTELENKYSNIYFTMDQLDVCLYRDSAVKKSKHIGWTTPDIIVVPDISVGNGIYKAMMKTYNFYGFVVGGTTPAILNSRSDLDKNEECIKIFENGTLDKWNK